ncbi:MAG: hypothetical protein HY675_07765 [Chloroflexi bacterium]|nr:hypothetical protein [Chloroflexota bacterium]
MDKVFSARVDEAVLDEMSRVAGKLGVTKRQFLEEAIRLRVQQFSRREDADVWAETVGAWRRRRESATATIRTARRQFQKSFERHHGRS